MDFPQQIPADINAEVLLDYFPEGSMKVSMQGKHKRNTYGDLIDLEPMGDFIHLTVGRSSIYNTLPEYMFHPIDRFDNLPQYEEKERFREQVEEQAHEIADAYRFFLPIDLMLLRLKTAVRKGLESYASEDVIMQQIIGDSLTDRQKKNRFIRQVIPFLPQTKNIRGNLTLITLLLRKVFMEEGLRIDVSQQRRRLYDERPRYGNIVGAMTLGDSYSSSDYDDEVTVYDIHYWSDDECGKEFLRFIDDLEELRMFLQDYFLAVGSELVFNVQQDYPALRLGDEVFYNYLNYNTNI